MLHHTRPWNRLKIKIQRLKLHKKLYLLLEMKRGQKNLYACL